MKTKTLLSFVLLNLPHLKIGFYHLLLFKVLTFSSFLNFSDRMNILHYVTQKQEISPKLKKLKATCDAAAAVSSKTEGGASSSSKGECGAESLGLYDKDELQKRLSAAQFRVTQKLGTEK